MNWDLWSFIIGFLAGIVFLIGFMGICCCMVASRGIRKDEERDNE
jgi:hypothetical protein